MHKLPHESVGLSSRSRHKILEVFLLLSLCSIAAIGAQNQKAQDSPAAPQPSAWDSPAFSLSPDRILALSADLKGQEGDDSVYALENETYRYEADGSSEYSCHVFYKILIKKGVEKRNSVSCSYQPWRQEKPLIKARVISPNGTVSILDQSTLADQSATEEDDVYTDARTLTAPLPAIDSGAVVEYTVDLKDKAPLLANGSSDRAWFGRRVTIIDRSITIDYPAQLPLRYKIRGDGASAVLPSQADSGNGRKTLVLSAHNLPGVSETEDYLQGSDVPQTCVDFSTGASWADVASAYANIAEPILAKADVRDFALAALKDAGLGPEALKGAADQRSKAIAAILYRIRRDVRYTGINFGENAIVPHACSETITRGYGDCKDQAILMVAALRSLGVKANVALLFAGYGSDVLDELPGFGLFNHAIAYLPDDRAWIDPTASYYHFGELPAMDHGRKALVIAADTTGLSLIPDSKSADNVYEEVRIFSLAEDGPASVSETTTTSGMLGADYRYHFATSDAKNTREHLESYVKSAYKAEKLDSYSITDPQDMDKAFVLVAKASKAKRGFTDQSSSSVLLQSGTLFNFVPDFLKDKPEGDKAFTRKNPVKLDEPYVATLRYRLIPPLGFKAAALPENSRRQLGPASLDISYSLETDGSITAIFKFDTVKSTYTADEATALQAALVAYEQEDAPSVGFDQIGASLLSAGKYREALAEFNSLVTAEPKMALHHIQLSQAYEAASFGDLARKEAQKAVQLEPDNADAHARLGWTYLIGPFARLFEAGCDPEASKAEYAAAAKLDPDKALYIANQAIIDEYGSNLQRYSHGAKMDEALSIYQKSEKLLKGTDWEDNEAYALLRMGRFKELKETLKTSTTDKERKALYLAAVAAIDGAPTALREATRVSQAADERREVLSTASSYLMTGRHYPESADLMTAGAMGSQSKTQALALAASLRTAKPVSLETLPQSDPMGLIIRFLSAMYLSDDSTTALRPLFSSSLLPLLDESEEKKSLTDTIANSGTALAGSDQSPEAVIDLVAALGKIDVVSEGVAEAVLCSYPIQPSQTPILLYVVKEEGSLKLVSANEDLSGIALEMLDLLDAKQLDKARDWAKLLKTQQQKNPIFPSLDKLPAMTFIDDPAKADDRQLRLFASYILCVSKNDKEVQRSLPVVLLALDQEKDKDRTAKLAEAAVMGLLHQKKAAEAISPARKLASLKLDQEYAHRMLLVSLEAAGREAEAASIIKSALAATPASPMWLRMKSEYDGWNKQFDDAAKDAVSVLDSPDAQDSDYNQLAWYTLFETKPDYKALDSRQIVQRLMAGSPDEIHTIACVLADSGRLLEAQEALKKYLGSLGPKSSLSSAWLAFGMYAESFGLRETAMEAYAKVQSDDNYYEDHVSSWDLAQLHLKKLGADKSAGNPAAQAGIQ